MMGGVVKLSLRVIDYSLNHLNGVFGVVDNLLTSSFLASIFFGLTTYTLSYSHFCNVSPLLDVLVFAIFP
jgi:hypothetical protein